MTTKRSFLPRTLIGGAALLLMTGCSSPDVPSPPSVSEVQLEAFVGTFFEYLEENEPGAALRMTNLVHSTPRVDDALLDGHLYALNEAPLKLLEATTRWVRPPLALVDVTYTMGGKELHDAVLVHEITRLAGEPVAAAGGFRIELSDGAFGIDVDGVQYLPSDTTYSIFGTDVTEAITAVGQNSDLTANQRFTLPAFGGTYVLEIDVPGEAGFTESVTIDTTSFHGVSREPGKIVKIAEQHGFTDVLWGG